MSLEAKSFCSDVPDYLMPSSLRSNANFWGELAAEIQERENPTPTTLPLRIRDNLFWRVLRKSSLVVTAGCVAVGGVSLLTGDINMGTYAWIGAVGSLLLADQITQATSSNN